MARRHEALSDRDYARLLAIRTTLREFERWSADQAAAQGLTARQHQLLLAVRGDGQAAGPTVRDVSRYLLVQHNTAVELASRTEALGLIERVDDEHDHRSIRLRLTDAGRERLAALSATHIEELTQLRHMLNTMVDELQAP